MILRFELIFKNSRFRQDLLLDQAQNETFVHLESSTGNHRLMRLTIIWALTIFCITLTSGQGEWKLKKNKDAIRVYTRNAVDSKIKELKIELEVYAPYEDVVFAINDIESCVDWVYACKEVKIVETLNKDELMYYTQVKFPWPLQDRDAYLKSVNTRTPTTFASRSEGVYDYQPRQKKHMRIPSIQLEWYLEKKSENEVFVRYYLKSDPGGAIPAWAINLALDKGPLQSMRGLRKFVKGLEQP